jgi:hypothetical protein
MNFPEDEPNKFIFKSNFLGKRSDFEKEKKEVKANSIFCDENMSISSFHSLEENLLNLPEDRNQFYVESKGDDFKYNFLKSDEDGFKLFEPEEIDADKFGLFEKNEQSLDTIPKKITDIINEEMQQSQENDFKMNQKNPKRLKKIKKSKVQKNSMALTKTPIQVLNYPIESNRPKNNDQKINYYSAEELRNVFSFIQKYVHFDKSDGESAFDKLSQNSKTFLSYYLKKVYSLKIKPKKLCFQKFCKIQQKNKKKRRNEEKLKLVYKNALKEFKREFNSLYINLRNQTKTEYEKKLFTEKEVGFHFWMFQDTVLNKKEHVDFILDVCFEKYGVKTEDFSRKDGWRMAKSNRAMKKISATYRYLVKQDPICKGRFLGFLDYSAKRGMVYKFKTEIVDKLDKKFNKLKEELYAVDLDFDEFINKFREIMNDKKYKNPWLMKDVKESIDYCVYELEEESPHLKSKDFYSDLTSEYLRMKQMHYSSSE